MDEKFDFSEHIKASLAKNLLKRTFLKPITALDSLKKIRNSGKI